jgi:hypothetical protein
MPYAHRPFPTEVRRHRCCYDFNQAPVSSFTYLAIMLLNFIAQWTIIFYSLWLIGVSFLMVYKPHKAIDILRKAGSTNLINYMELSIRGIWGLALIWFSSYSLFPQIFMLMGITICVTSILLMIIPRRWHAHYAVWWSNQLKPTHVRILAPLSFVFALWMIYATL